MTPEAVELTLGGFRASGRGSSFVGPRPVSAGFLPLREEARYSAGMALRVRQKAIAAAAASLFAILSLAAPVGAQQPTEVSPPPLAPAEPAASGAAAEAPPSAAAATAGPGGAATAPTSPAGAASEPPPEKPTDELKPMQLDVRATLNADVLLAYIGLGASADLGLVPVGPGTFAVGAGFEYDFCGSVCWFFSAATPLEFSHRQIWPQARASYHISLPSSKQKLDFYPFVGVGPVFARSQLSVDNGAARYVGTDTSIGVNFGGGLNLFVAGPVFIGGEARVRWAAGEYEYKLESVFGYPERRVLVSSSARGERSPWP